MDEDFFGQQAPQQTQYQQAQPAQNHDDEFDFGDAQIEQPQQQLNYGSNSNIENTNFGYSTQPPIEVDDQTTLKIQQEEQRIQEQLRQKSNDEYEKKQQLKEKGRKQLEEFMEKKEEQKASRKRENLQKEQKRKQELKTLNEGAGWKKVAENVALKQGEYPGSKPVDRMRESILNKKNDEA